MIMIEKLEGSTVLEIIRKLPEQSKYDCKSDLILGTDDQKSELVKDVTAIANAHGQETGYLFYGVDLRQADPVVGLMRHYDDATLQQMVNSKLEKPVSFLYYETHTGDHAVGVVVIPSSHNRPHIVSTSFGKLKAGQIPIRRGSSTAWANSDDLRLMLAGQPARQSRRDDVAALLRNAGDPTYPVSKLAVEAWQLASPVVESEEIGWLRKEIVGYSPDDENPPHRLCKGYVSLYEINPFSLSHYSLDTIASMEPDKFAEKQVGVPHSIAELEDLLAPNEDPKGILVVRREFETRKGKQTQGYIYFTPRVIKSMITNIRGMIVKLGMRLQPETEVDYGAAKR